MDKFEDFLIAEFTEQHMSMRQTEVSTIQVIQFAFAIEGVVIAGVFSLGTLGVSFQQIGLYIPPIFWLLFFFGHLAYQIAISAMITTYQLDFQNQLTRLYFGLHSSRIEYLYFVSEVENFSPGERGEWENLTGNMPSVAKFIGNMNSVNLLLAFISSLYAIATILSPHFNISTIIESNGLLITTILIVILFGIAKFYNWFVYIRTVRRAEKETLERRKIILERIRNSSIKEFVVKKRE